MSHHVQTLVPTSTIMDACKKMRETDCGFLVIVDQQRNIVGVITDRDIVLKLAQGYSLDTALQDVMKKNVITVNQDALPEDASDVMGNMQVKRLVVVDSKHQLVGVLSLSDLARNVLLEEYALEALTEISYDLSTSEEKATSFCTETYQL